MRNKKQVATETARLALIDAGKANLDAFESGTGAFRSCELKVDDWKRWATEGPNEDDISAYIHAQKVLSRAPLW